MVVEGRLTHIAATAYDTRGVLVPVVQRLPGVIAPIGWSAGIEIGPAVALRRRLGAARGQEQDGGHNGQARDLGQCYPPPKGVPTIPATNKMTPMMKDPATMSKYKPSTIRTPS